MTDLDGPIVNIEGELVALGPLRREHIPLCLRWINDFGTTRMLGVTPRPMTLEQEAAWYEQTAANDGEVAFTIYERATGRAIGNCGLHEVDLANRRTVVGIMIGEPDARGRGYGTEAMRLLLDYAFTVLGLHSVMLTVFEYNGAGRRCYEKVGFRESGRRRESRWINGRFWDEIHMDILATEFTSPVLAAVFSVDERK
ncbi:MAG: GCN5-related N-acetyltransferase [Thermomicrobiales bacterium]|nr:GCN5-related N-acetyltransferase [Thermomicrobiales bacterium]